MSENKADPLREALAAFTNFIDEPQQYEHLRMVRIQTARAAPQPAAPLGGRETIARIIFDKACGLSLWDNDFYAEERQGCLETADAILAIPQERGVDRAAIDPADLWEKYCLEVKSRDRRSPQGAMAYAVYYITSAANVVAGTDRAAIIAECAKVAERYSREWDPIGSIIAEEIRALAGKETGQQSHKGIF